MYKGNRNWLLGACIAALLPITASTADGNSSPRPRQAEFLDRGVVAVNTDAGVFVSWRLLGNEP